MAFPLVQAISGSFSTQQNPTATFTNNNVTQGNDILVFISWNAGSGTVSSVTDSLSNTYAAVGTAVTDGTRTLALWRARAIATGGACTVTANLSASEASAGINIFEVQGGLATGNDGYHTNTGTATTSPTSGSITTTGNSDVIWGFYRGGTLSSIESGWNQALSGGAPEYVVKGPGTYAATWTTTSSTYAAIVAAFVLGLALDDTTTSVSNITQTTATLNGNLGSLGPGGNATIEGFQWGLTTAYGNDIHASGSFGVGSYSQNLTGLTPGATYHFRAYATSPDGTAYGLDHVFNTNFADNPSGEVLFNGTQLSGGTTVSGSVANMFDGNNQTEWNTSATGSWAGIDCTVATPLTRVRISPQAGYVDAGIGAQIQGSNDPTFATGVSTLFTINNRMTVPTLSNEFDVSTSALRYYRVLANGINWNLADVDFIGTYASGVTAQCVAPTISPPGGNYDLPVRVRISCITGAHIFYTLDGSTPTSNSTPYTGPFVVSTNTIVNAIAYSTGLAPSRVSTYWFICPSRLFSHQPVYDNLNHIVTSMEGCYFDNTARDGYFYHYLMDLESPPGSTFNRWDGFRCYRSADFRNWEYRSNVCGPAAGAGLGNTVYDFRLRMLYCPTSGNYVAWTDPDGNLHGSSGLKSWTSSSPEGPFTLAATYTGAAPLADGFTGGSSTWYGDIGVFVDTDGKAYLAYNYNNNGNTAISQLNPANFTNTLGPGVNSSSVTCFGEAFSMCKRGSTYFMLFSGTSGGSYNTNQYMTATAPIGPYSGTTNPFQSVSGYTLPQGEGSVDYTKAYQSQTDQIVTISGRGTTGGLGAGDCYIWIGDDGQPSTAINKTRLHIPMVFPTSGSTTITWQPGTWFDGTAAGFWSLDTVFPTISGAPAAPTNFTAVYSGGVASLGWTNNEPKAYYLYLDRASDAGFSQNAVSEVLTPGTSSFNDTNVAIGTFYFYRVRAVNANGTSSSPAMFLSTGAAPLTLQTFLSILPPDDTIIWNGLQWRPGPLVSTLAFANDPRLPLRISINGTATTLLNGDGSVNSTPLNLVKRWWGEIE